MTPWSPRLGPRVRRSPSVVCCGVVTLRATTMSTSLRDIPGAQPRTRRRPPGTWPDGPRPAVLFDPRQGLDGGRRRRRPLARYDGRGPRLSPVDALLAAALVGVALFVLHGMWTATRVHVRST